MNDPVNHPSHYNSWSGVECLQLNACQEYLLGNATKYMYRHRDKGAPLQDLKKALFYVETASEYHSRLYLHIPKLFPEGTYEAFLKHEDWLASQARYDEAVWFATIRKLLFRRHYSSTSEALQMLRLRTQSLVRSQERAVEAAEKAV